MSSDELDARALLDILFEVYTPTPYARNVGRGRVDGVDWLLMFDAKLGPAGFFLTPAASSQKTDRILFTKEQASASFSIAQPLFSSFAAAAALCNVVPAGSLMDSALDKIEFIDVFETDLGTISLEVVADGFRLSVAKRQVDEAGVARRRRDFEKTTFAGQALSQGINAGLSPLKAACELAPNAIRSLFPHDRRLETNVVRELVRRAAGGSGAEASPPKKPRGGL